jgi:signal transduction histidine kinase
VFRQNAAIRGRTRLEKIYGARIEVVGESDLTVFGRRDHVEQAISNLVDNALKYSPEGSAVKVAVGESSLEVSNAGTGLPESVVERLGMPFNLGPNAARRSTGLGLAWVVTISKLYGWRLTHERREDRTVLTLNFAGSDPASLSTLKV